MRQGVHERKNRTDGMTERRANKAGTNLNNTRKQEINKAEAEDDDQRRKHIPECTDPHSPDCATRDEVPKRVCGTLQCRAHAEDHFSINNKLHPIQRSKDRGEG